MVTIQNEFQEKEQFICFIKTCEAFRLNNVSRMLQYKSS